MISLNNTTREQDKELEKIDDGLEAVKVVLNELDDEITEKKERIETLEKTLDSIIDLARNAPRGEDNAESMDLVLIEITEIAQEAK